MKLLATFHTHYASQIFLRKMKREGVSVRMMPVPRSLSASCGTCVVFDYEGDFIPLLVEDTDKVYRIEEIGYTCMFECNEQ